MRRYKEVLLQLLVIRLLVIIWKVVIMSNLSSRGA